MIYISIQIKAPARLIGTSSSVWYGLGFVALDVDRVDMNALSNVMTYQQSNGTTNIAQYKSSKISCILTGHITSDSALPGADVTEKTINLLETGKTWYYGLYSRNSGFPQYKNEYKTYDCAIEKISIIDEARFDSKLISYQLGLILKWSD